MSQVPGCDDLVSTKHDNKIPRTLHADVRNTHETPCRSEHNRKSVSIYSLDHSPGLSAAHPEEAFIEHHSKDLELVWQ